MKTASKFVLSIFVVWMLSFPAAASAANSCLGFEVPNSASLIEKNRYQVSLSWEGTLRFYKKAYRGKKGVERSESVALPGVKSIHYRNLSGKGKWAGANVSRIRGRVYVFCYEEKPKGK